MKERSIKAIHRRVMSRLKGLGAMLLALFVALTAIPVMPAMEALAESGDNYYLVVGAPWSATFLGKGHEMDSKPVFAKDNNSYFKDSGLGLRDNVTIEKIADLKVGNEGETVVTSGVIIPEKATAYVGCVFFNEYSGSIITVKIDDSEQVETTGLYEEGKGRFELPAAKYDIESTWYYSSPSYKRTINFKTVGTLDPATVSKKPEANTLTYTGSGQALVTAGTAENGTMQYALGKDTTTTPESGWDEAIPTGTDARTYYVWYKAKGDGDHADSDPGVVSVTIKEKTSSHTHTIKMIERKEPTYTEDGYKEHYECTECGKWFADISGSYEYSDEERQKLIIPKLERRNDSSSSSDSDSDSGSSGGGSRGKSGSFSTQSLDVNGNVFGGPSAGHQPDSGMPLSDRGGNWGSIANNWSYTKADGNLARNEWLNLEYNGHTYWYFFDGNSTMQTDWLNYNGATYYFVPDMDGWRGRMATGWHQIGEKWYYFEPTAGAYQGVMYRGAVTPDGHIVGADGAWNGVGTTPESSAQTGTTASGT